MSKQTFFLLLLIIINFILCYCTSPVPNCKNPEDYDGYKILQWFPRFDYDDEVVNLLTTLEGEGKLGIIGHGGHKGFVVGHYIDVLIPPEHASFLFNLTETLMEEGKAIARVITSDLKELISSKKMGTEEPRLPTKSGLDSALFGYQSYHTMGSMYDHLLLLALLYPDIAEVITLDGSTYEGRKIKALRITNNISNPSSADKPMAWLDGGTHSREWISPAAVMYIADALTGHMEPGKSVKISALRDVFQFVIAPVVNPDGYEYTQVDRNWRKNRKPSGCRYNMRDCAGNCVIEQCYGSDPNRNWDIDFGVLGTSTDPCDISFPGKEPFDQNCVQIVRNFLVGQREKLALYINFHSYSQLFLYPWGHTKQVPVHNAHHTLVGEAYVGAIKNTTGELYLHHRIVEIYHNIYPNEWYEVSGTSIDWIYKNLGVVNSYGVELRDRGEQMFKLSPDQILPTAMENFAGLIAILDIVRQTL